MDIEKNPAFYLASDVQELLGYKTIQGVYYARRHKNLPPGHKIGVHLKWPRYQIDAILRGEDWRSAKPPNIDASTAPTLAGATGETAGDSPAGTGGADILEILADRLAVHLADRVADQLEKRFREGGAA